MMRQLVAVSMFVTSAAIAEPIEPAAITYINVDAQARAALERAAGVITSCRAGSRSPIVVCKMADAPPLGVRVVTTTGGLYLLAQDGPGHQHEGVVDDARAAGALIASWLDEATRPSPPPP